MAQNSTPQHSFLPQPQDKKNYLKIFLKFLQFWIDLLSQIFAPFEKFFILSWKKTLVYFPTQKFLFFSKNVFTLQDVRWPSAKLLIPLYTLRWILIKHNSNTLGQLQIKLQRQGNNNVFPWSQKNFLKLIEELH